MMPEGRGTEGTKGYTYQSVPTAIEGYKGTTPFRGVPFVPSPESAPDTDYPTHEITHALLIAAMRACDHNGDDYAARRAMRRECMELPLRLQADLLAHFEQTYPKETP